MSLRTDLNKQDQGFSLPLVLGAMLLFAVLTILLTSVAVVSVRHSNWALNRTQALAAAEAGAQDFVNRMNGYAAFDSWTAERTGKFRKQGRERELPQIVRESALAQWHKVEGTSQAEYTYDIVGNNNGIIMRSTGRSGPNRNVKRSIEYRITRNSDSAVAYVGNKATINTDAYAQQAELFKGITHEQGYMAVNHNSWKRLTTAEYHSFCSGTNVEWERCWRPTWSGHDQVEGNFIQKAPFTINGPKSFLYPAARANQELLRYPKISGSITLLQSKPDEFTHGAGFEYANGRTYIDFYTDQEAIDLAGRKKYEYLPFDETIGSSPANYTVIRSEAKTFDSCNFKGSTQVVLHGDTIYVRSPHTPETNNDDKNDWCKSKTRQLWGRTKRTAGPDMTRTRLYYGDFLRPMDESTWVKFDNLPNDAVFLVERASVCNTAVTGDQSSIGKSTGLGFPGTAPTVSSSDAGQNNLYNCKNGDLFIEGAVAFRKTFAAEDNIYLTGGIRYTDRDPSTGRLPVNSDDLLGLVAKRNVIIYNPSPPRSSNCPNGCGKLPRSAYALPTREQDLSNDEIMGQGILALQGFNKWRIQPDRKDPATGKSLEKDIVMTDPTTGKVDAKPTWLALPQFDAAIVAEEGSFFLENFNVLKDKPTILGGGSTQKPLKMVVTGSVYSHYAPVFHVDRIPLRDDSWTNGRIENRDTSRLEVYGMNQLFIFDKRFTKRLPPGFSGHSDSAYRTQDFAEVFQGHLNP